MQIERLNEQVEHELMGRLRINGKWYGRGDKVTMDKADAEVYRLRGFSRPTVPEKQADGREKVPASQVGAIKQDVEPLPVKQDEAPLKNDQPVRRAEPESTNAKLRGKGR